jgi:uncharacterized membrane protein YqiK
MNLHPPPFDVTSLAPYLIGLAVLAFLLILSTGVRVIPNNRVAVVERRWSRKGSVKSGFIALNGEAGYQPEMLRGGVHWLTPFQYRIHKAPLVSIPQGRIGYVFARDGQSLDATQTLANGSSDFQDARRFLVNGGQRGPQLRILREGTYAINPALFAVFTDGATFGLELSDEDKAELHKMAAIIQDRNGFCPVTILGTKDQIGIVTVHDGPGLAHGEIIAPIVGEDPKEPGYHNNFQDPDKFLKAGGRRGRQHHVLIDGTYYINRLFATVELIPKTIIEVGYVGVVVSYTGAQTADVSGQDYSHGELVKKGSRGVWEEGLLPGKYAWNTYAGNIIMVPTTNFILKWEEAEVSQHKFDENLCEVGLITKDAFEPWLPLSVVVHIDYRKAPLVIQRFGDIQRLVNQTLDPMVSAYFKNVAQARTLIELIQQRALIQTEAAGGMKAKFAQYNLELEEVLIGTPSADDNDKQMDVILTQLRARQVAEEQVATYERQQKAAFKERELKEVQAKANVQQKLTESELSIQIQENTGKAELQQSIQKAAQTRALAEAEADKNRAMAKAAADTVKYAAGAEAERLTLTGQAEASKIKFLAEAEADRAARVGIAQAMAIEEQVRAYGGPKFQLTQQVMNRFSEAIQDSKVDVVPRIVVGQQAGQGSGVFETLLTMMLSEKIGESVMGAPASPKPASEALRKQITESLASKPESKPKATTPTPRDRV